jgi:hypothetical protein
VPAPVLVEVARSTARRAALDRILRRLPVVNADRAVATRTGGLLGAPGLDSRHAVDALVAATALGERPAVLLTGDPHDLTRLVGDASGARVQALP